MGGAAHIRIGTSGWHYPHWRGNFYPPDLPTAQWLSFYCGRFDSVEINNSFYQLPSEDTFRVWREMTPAGFLFAVKASRYITHMKKLMDPQTSTKNFFERVVLLGEKLGPILFQLPPHWGANPERLDAFLAALPVGYEYAFEFRDPSWLVAPVYEVLTRYGAGLCLYNFNRLTPPKELTANFVYIRLHGPGGPYQGSYTAQALAEWAQDIGTWTGQGRSIYCYFDNDTAGYAPRNALALMHELALSPQNGG
jgi:uncharacterized protein YecE (DUF72 family)